MTLDPRKQQQTMRALVYEGAFKVALREVPYPTFQGPRGEDCREHGIILKVLTSAICGSDMHPFRGRAVLNPGIILGHEFTGEVVEAGPDVKKVKIGDIVSVPFNIACGRCDNCKKQLTNLCLTVNDELPGGMWGYPHGGGWHGGQAEYVMVPFADFQVLKFPNKEQAMAKLVDLSLLTDVLPTAMHAAVTAGVKPGATVFIAGAGPIGLASVLCCDLLGAAVVIVADGNVERLNLASKLGASVIDLGRVQSDDQVGRMVGDMLSAFGTQFVDCAIDAVGMEAFGPGHLDHNVPTGAVHECIKVTKAGGGISIPGVYLSKDPGAPDPDAKHGLHRFALGDTFMKGLTISQGQTPVARYNRELMVLILADRLHLKGALNIQVISLEDAPRAYELFAKGVPGKFLIDVHNVLGDHANLDRLAVPGRDQSQVLGGRGGGLGMREQDREGRRASVAAR